jgi:hypothetical protein
MGPGLIRVSQMYSPTKNSQGLAPPFYRALFTTAPFYIFALQLLQYIL